MFIDVSMAHRPIINDQSQYSFLPGDTISGSSMGVANERTPTTVPVPLLAAPEQSKQRARAGESSGAGMGFDY